MGRTILPLTYLPDIEWFSHFLLDEECIIDIGEHYIKRSARNRTSIMSANGVLSLSIPLLRANRPQTPMERVEIDHSQRWAAQHWRAIESAYRSSPYFEILEEYFRPVFDHAEEYPKLVDFNMALLRATLRFMGSKAKIQLSENYVVATEDDCDLRPKNRPLTITPKPYFQLFSDRFPFAENLSILDLLMSEGLDAAQVIKNA